LRGRRSGLLLGCGGTRFLEFLCQGFDGGKITTFCGIVEALLHIGLDVILCAVLLFWPRSARGSDSLFSEKHPKARCQHPRSWRVLQGLGVLTYAINRLLVHLVAIATLALPSRPLA